MDLDCPIFRNPQRMHQRTFDALVANDLVANTEYRSAFIAKARVLTRGMRGFEV